MTAHDRNRDQVPKMVRSVWPPILLIALSAAMFVWSAGYNETARQVPMLAAGTLFVLAAFDLVLRFDVPALEPLRDFWGADFRNREMRHDPSAVAEAAQIAWMVACVAAMLTIGILPAVPVFVAAYMVFNGRRRVAESLITAALVFGFVYLVFEVLLEYQLYRGVIFDPRGFDRW